MATDATLLPPLVLSLGPSRKRAVGATVDPPKYALGHSYKAGCAVFSSTSAATTSAATDAVVRAFQIGKLRSSFASASRAIFCKVSTATAVRLPKFGPARQLTQWCLGNPSFGASGLLPSVWAIALQAAYGAEAPGHVLEFGNSVTGSLPHTELTCLPACLCHS